MSCGVGGRCGSDPQLLWLWYRLVAAAPDSAPRLRTSISGRYGPKKEKKKKKKKKKENGPTKVEEKKKDIFISLKGTKVRLTTELSSDTKKVENNEI